MRDLNSGGNAAIATKEDVTAIVGEIDTDKLLMILSLRPTITDLEEVQLWLSGDADVFGAEPPIKGTASKIVTILTADEEEQWQSR